ncbi:MAG: tRNA preQ1(34) S-adenosylmethionine ribosyltransferase-isomerase QueA [Planctomycetota bacterium]
MQTDELDFHLPDDLIATRPVEPRDACKLLVCSRSDPDLVEHVRFADLPSFLKSEDVLVFNRSSVVPARLAGRRADTGGSVSGLYLETLEHGRWRCLMRSNGKLREGQFIELTALDPSSPAISLRIDRKREGGGYEVLVEGTDLEAAEVLDLVGATPLPPYILGARRTRDEHIDDVEDRDWYQAVYADPDCSGSVAAPTAGLHFTPALLDGLAAMGVRQAEVILHVGEGTFQPISAADPASHRMHEERFMVPSGTLTAVESARSKGGRAIAVGTTAVRSLESEIIPDHYAGTDLYIRPGHSFSRVDALITNFHLPRSTLLLLVSALFDDEPLDRLKSLYAQAIERRYRFFSYGDAMLILP